MTVKAQLKHLRIAPRKVRLVTDLIRRKSVDQALAILGFTNKGAAYSLRKLLNSAVANAKNNFQLDQSNLFITRITVDEGPKFKRWRARARGRAEEILKRTSHITLVLAEREKSQAPRLHRYAKHYGQARLPSQRSAVGGQASTPPARRDLPSTPKVSGPRGRTEGKSGKPEIEKADLKVDKKQEKLEKGKPRKEGLRKRVKREERKKIRIRPIGLRKKLGQTKPRSTHK